MAATSVALPFVATRWWLRGAVDVWPRHRRPSSAPFPDAVLFDRDGTLVEDVPYNGDPQRVRLRPGAARAVAELRAWGIPVGLVTNQSGIGRGLIRRADADAVNRRAAALVGGLDTVQVCEHRDEDRCGCRKPQPGLVLAASRALDVEPSRCVVIGDIGSDMRAAAAAGARGVLVPNGATRPEEVAEAVEVAPDLLAAVAMARGEASR
jgi:histidinol-phosphate phosphatase family protein